MEVCAGAGGWGLGLHRAGWTGTGIEHDPDAVATHNAHVGPCLAADVTTSAAPHPADLVLGGVPCQSFSTAGLQAALNDPRGQLFRSLLRIAGEVGARVCALENVRGMVSTGALKVILTAFRAAGFEPVHALLNACDYGVPQNRVRLFVVGFRHASDLTRFRWPAPSHGAPGNLFGLPAWRTVREALEVRGERVVGLLPHATSASPRGSRMLDPDAPATAVLATMGADLIGPERPLDRPAPTITTGSGDGLSVIRSQRTRRRFDAELSRLDRPAPTISAGGADAGGADAGGADAGGAEPLANGKIRAEILADLAAAGLLDRPCTTIDTQNRVSAAGHHTSNKAGAARLSPRDCARLQSFPDAVEFCGTQTSQYRQIGNAVPPPLGEAIGRAVFAALYGDPR